ncbi:MAG: GNAT family N-acetyltransferase [Candidatus Heimdallarchaeota archaeon]|nr:GNAT family N-acetyltransferase [Candidatus Heimdallarchaeota archaeon]
MIIHIRSILTREQESFLTLYKSIWGAFDSQKQEKNFQEYIKFKPYMVKIAIFNKRIIGFTIGVEKNSNKARLHSIYIEPEFRYQNIGTRLLTEIEAELLHSTPHLEYLSVRIHQENYDSINFFLKKDYDLITRINNYVKKSSRFDFKENLEIYVRIAEEDDVNELIEIENICFSHYWRYRRQEFINIIRSGNRSLFVAFLEGHIVGYNYNTISEDGKTGNYVRIATLPEYQRRHIGTTLTKKAFEWFEKYAVNCVLLSTYADSPVHNQMYRSWGFKKTDEETILAKHLK